MSDYLPEEVIRLILCKLPTKSLLKCLSVCKSWYFLIRNPKFISAHLAQTLSNPLLLFRWSYGEEQYSLHFDNEEFRKYTSVRFPPFPFKAKPYFRVVGSCNGLVCLFDNSIKCGYVNKIILSNPSLRKSFALPVPNAALNVQGNLINDIIAFGFDSVSNDYKVLRMSLQCSDRLRLISYGVGSPCRRVPCEPLLEIEIYSLNHNSWKSVKKVPIKYGISDGHVPATLNGAFYWIVESKESGNINLILLFDLRGEDFHEIMLPESLKHVNRAELSIMVFGESSIAVVRNDWSTSSQYNTIWVMNESCLGADGIAGSWVKLSTVEKETSAVLGFRSNGEVLMELSDGKIVSVEPETQQTVDLGIWGYEYAFVGKYVESLVLLDKLK